jgi:hypothetical protein
LIFYYSLKGTNTEPSLAAFTKDRRRDEPTGSLDSRFTGNDLPFVTECRGEAHLTQGQWFNAGGKDVAGFQAKTPGLR